MEYIHCKVVILETTTEWSTEYVERAGGAIFRAYMFDKLKRDLLRELHPQYELHPLFTTPLRDDENETLARELALHEDGAVLHQPCRRIDALSDAAVFDYGVEEVGASETRATAFQRKVALARRRMTGDSISGSGDSPNTPPSPDLTNSAYVSRMNAVWAVKPASMLVVEYAGRGDPFFGGNGDDRVLGTDGKIKERLSLVPSATFPTVEEAHAAALKIPNRRPGSTLGVAPTWLRD